jgi:hypothetical protein
MQKPVETNLDPFGLLGGDFSSDAVTQASTVNWCNAIMQKANMYEELRS